MAPWSRFLARPGRGPVHARPSLTLFFLLAGAFLLTLVPHAVQFPYWLSVTILVTMIVRCVLEVYRLPLPSTTICGAVALLLSAAIFVQYSTVMGREAGTALTAGLLTIKFYELRRPRDVSLIIFSCFFVVMSALLYSQVVELFIYCLIMMWVLTALLVRVNAGDTPVERLLGMLRYSGLVYLQALPLTLILFFFFPRYTGHLGLTLDEATVGLSSTLAPGSIAKLSQNDSEAMYVQFPPGSNIPLPENMYWRAMVLWQYEHGMWIPGDIANAGIILKPRAETEADRIEQTITVRTHHQKWLFALDLPDSIPINPSESDSWAIANYGHVVQLSYSSGKLDHLARYSVTSSDILPKEDLIASKQRVSEQLPDDAQDHIDPSVIALADKLHEGLNDQQEMDYIYAVLRYFRHNGFSYTATPGIQGTGPSWLADFMFKSKAGFCEHYASAFAVLMRLEHIPARIVVGYVGAEYNPYTDQYTVSQSNAHAWDEVFIWDKDQPPGGVRGEWRRFDPTALITGPEPGRQAGKSDNPADAGVRMMARQETLMEKYLPPWAREDLREIKLRREEIESNWDNLVLSYDTSAQDRLAQALGFGDRSYFGLFTACLAAGAACVLVFWRWIKHKPSIHPVEQLYAAFCRFMAGRGHPRASWEGPLAYTNRVAEAFPESKPAIHRVGSIVARERYGAAPNDPAAPDKLQSLLTLITASNAAASSRERR